MQRSAADHWRGPIVVVVCGCLIAVLTFVPRTSMGDRKWRRGWLFRSISVLAILRLSVGCIRLAHHPTGLWQPGAARAAVIAPFVDVATDSRTEKIGHSGTIRPASIPRCDAES